MRSFFDNSTTFDKVGNRLTKTEGSTTANYTYNNVNEMLTAGSDSYTYDQNGNTLSGGGRDYGWDQQNRLKAVTKDGTTVRFTYRTDGLRARKEVVGGLTIDYVYDGQTVIGEKRSDGKSVWYTPGPNGYINRTETDANDNVTNKEWFVYDGLGSCRAMVKPNAQGTEAVITARMDYDVYGKVRTQSGSTESKFKYVGGSCGHPTDDETGLIYMRARYYDPGAGRFVSEDSAKDRDNWYIYVADNPINFIDPDGKAIWSIVGIVNFLINKVITPVLVETGIIGDVAAKIIAWSVAIATIAAVVLTIVIISATAAIYIIEWMSRIQAAMNLVDGDLFDERVAERWYA